MTPLEAWNYDLLMWFAAAPAASPWCDALAVFFAWSGPYLLASGLVVGWLWGRGRRAGLLESAEAGLVGLAVNQVIALFTFHPRPYMLGLVRPLLTHAYETSFPSDHATLLFAVGVYLAWDARRPWAGGAVLALGLLTSWGRVYSGVHFPLDIVGSVAVALCAAVIVRCVRARLGPAHRRLVELYAKVFAGPIRSGWVRNPGLDPE